MIAANAIPHQLQPANFHGRIITSRPSTSPLISPSFLTVRCNSEIWHKKETKINHKWLRHGSVIPRGVGPSGSSDASEESSDQDKVNFGYSRKDVLLIGLGVTVFGVALKSGLEFVGVDPLQAGNVVQLIVVLGMTIGWILSYIVRVANKDMTYAQQLRDYESKVMEKRLEGLTEAELQVLMEQVEEEKRSMAKGEQVN